MATEYAQNSPCSICGAFVDVLCMTAANVAPYDVCAAVVLVVMIDAAPHAGNASPLQPLLTWQWCSKPHPSPSRDTLLRQEKTLEDHGAGIATLRTGCTGSLAAARGLDKLSRHLKRHRRLANG